jgi:capsular polysaccharide biosynthesis protein/Mrp family chromosome partitioning ATPase
VAEAAPALRHHLHVLRRQIWLIAVCAAAGVAVAFLVTSYEPPTYRASMKIVVGQGGGIFQAPFGATIEPFTQTMTNLLESDIVASTVIDNLRLDTSPQGLLGKLHVSSRPESSVLELSYDSRSKAEAVKILGEIGSVFARLVDQRLGSRAEPRTGADTLPPITATVFDPAHLRPGQVAPRPVRSMALAGILGVALGLVFAFAREALDDRIRGRLDAEAWFKTNVIGTLPKGFRGKKPFGLAKDHSSPRPELVEAASLLRANLEFSQAGINGPLLVVTSALPGEGKTTISAQVAVSLAMAGHDVICVEVDMRRPRLQQVLGLDAPKRGLVDVLQGAEAEDALMDVALLSPGGEGARGWLARARQVGERSGDRATNGPVALGGRLRVLLAGGTVPNPSHLLTRERLELVLDQLRPHADYVICDTPPLLIVGDSFPLIQLADRVVLVAREGKTNRRTAEAARATLEGLGVTRTSIVLTDSASREGYEYASYTAHPGRERVSRRPDV